MYVSMWKGVRDDNTKKMCGGETWSAREQKKEMKRIPKWKGHTSEGMKMGSKH